ncbi:tRNA (guanosine(46)-N7)-methyltransferase TrmB [Cryptosporangium aurantiacum]|uniref:tRNA (guanine-N(7)-)-methyltransferase n=1 Tax=Cryptosporangium aurantiacum TaxID=134849 RepID=A0A1M7TY74_9ACTN|nr:tRNA (guanosine(46)-N7)-methyltransferase TrmB [Cryptosporangium aurantiacum]SHN75681.1 tRNA (guanine-N(7)-)-methyltransferase [Cryptosporangium aurantiacum]
MTESATVNRTYKLRSGRVTPGQRRALGTLADRFAIPAGDAPLDLTELFGRDAPVVLEIGFGMGGTTLEMAQADPRTCLIAADVHVPGVGALLRGVHERGLDNVRVLHGDGAQLLEQRIPPASLAGVRLYFPDPWPKARHHKRRLVDARFAALVADRLVPGGRLHCATDWEPYAEQMVAVLAAEPGLELEHGGPVERPAWRPETKYETRGRAKGHVVADIFARRPAPASA